MMSFQRRAAILLATVAVFAGAATLAGRLGLDEDVSRMLPDASPDLRRAAAVMRSVMDRTIVDVAAPEGRAMPASDLGRAADIFADELRATGAVAAVRAEMQASDALPAVEHLRAHAARLLDEEALRKVEDKIRPEEVRRTLRSLARRLQEPDGAHLAARAASDPLGISDLALAPLAGLLAGFGNARLVEGRILSEDGRHLLVTVEPGFPATDAQRSEALEAAVARAEAKVRADPALAGVDVRWLGSHRSTLENARQIKRDVAVTSAIGVILVGGVAVLVFGRIHLALLALTPAIFGGVFALGAFALFRDHVSGLVAGFGAVLLGLTIDFAMHVLFEIDSSEDGNVHLPLGAVVAAATTTSVAFLSLLASSMPGLREIGVFGAVGTLSATAFTVLALPALAWRSGKARRPFYDLRVPIGRLQQALHGSKRGALVVVAALFIVTPFLALGATRLSFDGDVSRLSSLTPAGRADEAAMQAVWGDAFRISSVVVPGATLEEALRENDRAAALLDRLSAEGAIRAHGSIAALLPSLETQERRLAAWRAFFTEERVRGLRDAIAAGVKGTPFRANAFDRMFDWIARSPEPIGPEATREGPLAALVRDRIFASDGGFLVSTPVYAESFERVEGLRGALAASLPGATLVNKEALIRRVASLVETEMGFLGALGLILVAAQVYFWLGRVELAAIVVLPLLLGAVWLLGLLGWLGIPITLVNAIVVGFLFGVTVEYGIFLTSSRLDAFRKGLDEKTVASDAAGIMSAVTTAAGFGALAAAGHPVLYSIGITALLGSITATTSAFLFVPALAGLVLRLPGPNGTPRLRNMYAGLWVYWVMGGGGIIHLLFKRPFVRREDRERAAEKTIKGMATRIRHHVPIGRRIYIGEDERLAKPCVIVANHASIYDIICLMALPVRMKFVVAEKWARVPVLGHMAREAGYLVQNGGTPEAIVEQAKSALAAGFSLVIFPEGTRSKDGDIARFHNGAFAIARAAGVKVVPVALADTRSVVRPGTWWVGDHDVRVVVLDPIEPKEYPAEGGDRAMAREARERIRSAVAALRLDTQMGPDWWRPLAGLYRYLGTVISHYTESKLKRDPIIRALPEVCRSEGDILVVGCGYGLMTARLALAFPERKIIAVDPDERKIEVARAALRGSPNVEFRVADIRAVDPGKPGVALFPDVLHYWPEEAQREILAHVASGLRDGGLVLFRDGCAANSAGHGLVYAGEQFARWTGFTRTSEGRLHFRTAEGWRRLFAECGLSVESERPELGLFSNVALLCRKGAPLAVRDAVTVETAK